MYSNSKVNGTKCKIDSKLWLIDTPVGIRFNYKSFEPSFKVRKRTFSLFLFRTFSNFVEPKVAVLMSKRCDFFFEKVHLTFSFPQPLIAVPIWRNRQVVQLMMPIRKWRSEKSGCRFSCSEYEFYDDSFGSFRTLSPVLELAFRPLLWRFAKEWSEEREGERRRKRRRRRIECNKRCRLTKLVERGEGETSSPFLLSFVSSALSLNRTFFHLFFPFALLLDFSPLISILFFSIFLSSFLFNTWQSSFSLRSLHPKHYLKCL